MHIPFQTKTMWIVQVNHSWRSKMKVPKYLSNSLNLPSTIAGTCLKGFISDMKLSWKGEKVHSVIGFQTYTKIQDLVLLVTRTLFMCSLMNFQQIFYCKDRNILHWGDPDIIINLGEVYKPLWSYEGREKSLGQEDTWQCYQHWGLLLQDFVMKKREGILCCDVIMFCSARCKSFWNNNESAYSMLYAHLLGLCSVSFPLNVNTNRNAHISTQKLRKIFVEVRGA